MQNFNGQLYLHMTTPIISHHQNHAIFFVKKQKQLKVGHRVGATPFTSRNTCTAACVNDPEYRKVGFVSDVDEFHVVKVS